MEVQTPAVAIPSVPRGRKRRNQGFQHVRTETSTCPHLAQGVANFFRQLKKIPRIGFLLGHGGL